MQVTGMGIGFIDVRPEEALEYNQWWDTTMGPGNAALPEIAEARRYVAPTDYQKLRGPIEDKGFEQGRATYVHMYMFGTDDIPAGQASMGAIARRINDEGRNFGKGWSRYQGPHRLVKAHARKGLPVDEAAIPYLGHVAVHFSIGQITDKSLIPDVEAWYDEVHLPDILETPGFLSVMRLMPLNPEKEGRFIHVFYLDEYPKSALENFTARIGDLKERGRLESPGKSVRLIFGGPFRPIVPLQYDFLE